MRSGNHQVGGEEGVGGRALLKRKGGHRLSSLGPKLKSLGESKKTTK